MIVMELPSLWLCHINGILLGPSKAIFQYLLMPKLDDQIILLSPKVIYFQNHFVLQRGSKLVMLQKEILKSLVTF